jgi:murein DD-endopeptidase MepM/ murein hydrolase activator NlpD
MTALGVYYCPEHHRQSDRDYMAHLQPRVIRILDPDVQHIADMHALCPNAIIAPRLWSIDDNDGQAVRDLMADPLGTGRNHAQQFSHKWQEWTQQAMERGLRLPSLFNVLWSSANEPNQGGTPDKIAAYSIAFLNACTELGLRACAPCLGVGWPANTGPESPVDWSPYAGLDVAIRRNGGFLDVHEYFYDTGPQDGWTWWAGRHLQCPFDVPILLGEVGVDNYVDKARWENEGGNRGWQGNVSPDTYASQLEWHIRNSDTRVYSALVFLTDFRDNAWQSFDTEPAHGALLARKDAMWPQATPPPLSPEPQPPRPDLPDPPHPDLPPLPDADARVVWPCAGGIVSARFLGTWEGHPHAHEGLDIAARPGVAVLAATAGVVAYNAWDNDYGWYVRIYHAQRRAHTFYAHLLEQSPVQPGTKVIAGQEIGKVGSTGNSSGPHLHFEVRTGTKDYYINTTLGFSKGRGCPEAALWLWGCGNMPPGAGAQQAV